VNPGRFWICTYLKANLAKPQKAKVFHVEHYGVRAFLPRSTGTDFDRMMLAGGTATDSFSKYEAAP
jgi:hypothetical protein